MKKKSHGAAKVNRTRRSPAPKSDASPPPHSRLARMRANFAPRPPMNEEERDNPITPGDASDVMPSMDTRHLRRLLQGILLEIRSTRQYVMWLHEKLANHELGKEAEVPTKETLEANMTRKRLKEQERKNLKSALARRAASGVANGGMDLTEEERARISAGEDIETVLGGY